MQAVILAGGLATRLGERTRGLPKALLPIAGRPFLAWQLEALARSGFSEVVLCISHLGQQIRDFLGDGASFALTVAYSEDGPRLLGTGGALRRALGLLAPRFLVTYGDSYLPFDYSAPLRDLEAHPEALGTMSVFENAGAWDKSNSEVRGEVVVRYEKDGHDAALRYIDYGAIALCREVIAEHPPESAFGLDHVQSALSRRGKLRAFSAQKRFYEIGSEAGIRDLEALLSTP
ncbi:MAG TPA: NTP transferase domain-containing protein [Polyangiaceae bacterium]|jgi:MurNAc alpha-1-phosphate uridylyltransferase|nr:NTP transferase domain-containing protein [Polyangiaceae bacterium]